MANYQLDEIDRKILTRLIKDARTPFLKIARECKISGAAVHQRVKKLQDNDIITGSRINVKPGAIGLTVCAYISVTLTASNKYPEVVENLKAIPEITECHFVTGQASLLLKVFCLNNDHLMEVLLNKLQMLPYVQSTETMISLDEAFERQVWTKNYESISYQSASKKK